MDERIKDLEAQIDEQDARGDYTALLPLETEHAKLICEKYGERSVEYASALNDLGGVHRDIGSYAEAERLFLLGNDILAEKLGRNDPNYATSLNNTAGLYRLMGRNEEAERTFLEAMEIYKNTLGETHFLNVSAMNNLGLLYQDLGRYEEARALHEKALLLLGQEGTNVIGMATTLNNLATLCQHTGRRDEAVHLLEQVLEVYRINVGEAHPLYATALNNLAMCRVQSGDIAGALETFLLVEQKIVRMFGENSSYHKRALGNIAHVYGLLGDTENAKKYADLAK